MNWGKRGSKKYRRAQRFYFRTYRKTMAYKTRYKAWRRTPAGRIYRLRAALARVERNKVWINDLKLRKGCKKCGFKKWPECLDFDHRNPQEKTFNISQKLRLSRKTLLKEIKKCRILCANCHRHRTKIAQKEIN